MDLASCTTSAQPCADTVTSQGVWPLVVEVLLVAVLTVLVALAVRATVRSRRRRVRRPQRRAHVSATGELLRVEDLRPGPGSR